MLQTIESQQLVQNQINNLIKDVKNGKNFNATILEGNDGSVKVTCTSNSGCSVF